MSISTEITRLQNAKANIKTAIENKGVSVPSTTKLDGYNTLIGSIQAAKPEQSKTAIPTTSQQTVLPDSGYALSSVTVNAMPTGTVGTVSASKSISGNTATITPSISAGTAGYNTHAAATGTAVTVIASEIVSGTITITPTSSVQTVDVTNYATASVGASQSLPEYDGTVQ